MRSIYSISLTSSHIFQLVLSAVLRFVDDVPVTHMTQIHLTHSTCETGLNQKRGGWRETEVDGYFVPGLNFRIFIFKFWSLASQRPDSVTGTRCRTYIKIFWVARVTPCPVAVTIREACIKIHREHYNSGHQALCMQNLRHKQETNILRFTKY